MAPPENVLFVCKLNPVTSDEDLEIIFSRFGRVVGCEVIRDRVSGDSLQYAFVEFEDSKTCESAYFKMDNVLIDDRRIHVDFSQSVAKVQWRGKGRGLVYKDGQKGDRLNFGDLKKKSGRGDGERGNRPGQNRDRSRSPWARDRTTDRVRNNPQDERRQLPPKTYNSRPGRDRQDHHHHPKNPERTYRPERDVKHERHHDRNKTSDFDRKMQTIKPKRNDESRNRVVSPSNHRKSHRSPERNARKRPESPERKSFTKRSPERNSHRNRTPERSSHRNRSPDGSVRRKRSPEIKTVSRRKASPTSRSDADALDRSSSSKRARKRTKKNAKDKRKMKKSKKSKKTKKSSNRSSSSSSDDSDSSSSTTSSSN